MSKKKRIEREASAKAARTPLRLRAPISCMTYTSI